MKINCEKQYNPSSKGLDYSKVIKSDRGFVLDEIDHLKKLAKNYDISLKSDVLHIGASYKTITVTVSPIKSKLNFWQKIFKPKVSLPFFTEHSPYIEAENEYLVDIVKSAISYLER